MRGMRRRQMINRFTLNVECVIAKTGMAFTSDWIPGKDARLVAIAKFTDAVNPSGFTSVLVCGNDDKSSFLIANGGESNQRMQFQMYNNLLWPEENPLVLYLDEEKVYTFELNSTFMRCGAFYLGRNRTLAGTVPLEICRNQENNYKSSTFHIYGIKCWNNGVLERDFVPAKKNGIYGLYDKVNKRFWRSDTGVDFLGKDK